MSESTQHIVVLVIVALCVLFLLWQAFGSYFGRRSKLGKCCDKGCEPVASDETHTQFLPVEMLSRKK